MPQDQEKEAKKMGRPRVYDTEGGAPKLTVRLEPNIFQHVHEQQEGPRAYIEGLVREEMVTAEIPKVTLDGDKSFRAVEVEADEGLVKTSAHPSQQRKWNSTWTDTEMNIQQGEAADICRPALNALRLSLVGLVYDASEVEKDEKKPKNLIAPGGSGYLVEYNGGHYIATCGHVLTHPHLLKVYVGVEHSLVPLSAVCADLANDVKAFDNEVTDLGFVRISDPEPLLSAGKVFRKFDPEATGRIRKVKESVFFVLGYPGSLFSTERSTTRLPSGVYLPPRTEAFIQKVPVIDVVLFKIHDPGELTFRAILEGTVESESGQPFDTSGISGGPFFALMNRTGLEENPNGFQWLGIQSHQTVSTNPRMLVFQHPYRWAQFVDDKLDPDA